MTTKRTHRYYELAHKVRANLDDAGVKLDLSCPCDRAILSECGLTSDEAFEFLSLWDDIQDEDRRFDDTRRVPVSER